MDQSELDEPETTQVENYEALEEDLRISHPYRGSCTWVFWAPMFGSHTNLEVLMRQGCMHPVCQYIYRLAFSGVTVAAMTSVIQTTLHYGPLPRLNDVEKLQDL